MRGLSIRMLGFVIVLTLALAACNPSPAPQPTPSLGADLVATIVAQTLQAVPSQPAAATATPQVAQPTSQPTATQAAPTPQPSATPPPPTATPEPTSTQAPTATVPPQPSSTPSDDDPVTQLGGPTFTDNFDTTTYWPTDKDSFTDVNFDGGFMEYSALTDTDGWRLMTWDSLTDFYVEVRGQFENCSGTDHYGLIVRVPDKKDANAGYLFGISCDGRFTFNEWDGSAGANGTWTSHIYWKSHPAILAGEGKTNRIGIMAVGDRMTLYVNGEKVGEVKDGTFSEGFLGLYIGSDETDDLTVKIDELNLWDLTK